MATAVRAKRARATTRTTKHKPLCGNCPDCLDKTRAILDSEAQRPRDPLTTYGTGDKGRVVVPSDHAAHFPVYADGQPEFPTLPVTAERLQRHIRKYGSEGTDAVKVEDGASVERPRLSRARGPKGRRAQVQGLKAQGYTTLAISRELDLAVNTVERYLKEVA